MAITTRAAAEIARLEAIFSLYKADSALNRLNQDGILTAPPFELLQCLALSSQIHAASNGLFDPSIQPLWALYANRFAAGTAPTAEDLRKTQTQVGWQNVTFDEEAIRLAPGMALTLNGIAQGYIADRVAALLAANGLTRALIESRAPTMWRYAELLPLDGPPSVGLQTGMTPLVRADRLIFRTRSSRGDCGVEPSADLRIGNGLGINVT